MVTLHGTLSVEGGLQARLRVQGGIAGTLTIAGSVPSYHGDCTVTPGDVEQVIECSGLMMPQNIVIKPVPSQYGRIAWDGGQLTVY